VIFDFLMHNLQMRVVGTALRKGLSTVAHVQLLLAQVLHPLVSPQRHFRYRLELTLVAVESLSLALIQMLFHLKNKK
jgi:hypothetical protein